MATAGTFRSLEEKHEDYDRQAKASFASHTRRRGLFVSTIFLPKNRIIILPVLISIHPGLRRRVEKRSSRARAGGTWPPATLRGWMFKERRRKVGRVSRWFVDDRVYVLHLLVHTYTSWKVASWAKGLDVYLVVRDSSSGRRREEREVRAPRDPCTVLHSLLESSWPNLTYPRWDLSGGFTCHLYTHLGTFLSSMPAPTGNPHIPNVNRWTVHPPLPGHVS